MEDGSRPYMREFPHDGGAGPYHSAGCLVDAGTIHGQTWAEHRDFLFNWNAVRQ